MGIPKVFDIPDYRFDWKNSAFEYDDEIVKGLCTAIVRLALTDYYYAKEEPFKTPSSQNLCLSKGDLERFFRKGFFEPIMHIYQRDFDTETLIEHIRKKNYTPRELVEYEKDHDIVPHNKKRRRH